MFKLIKNLFIAIFATILLIPAVNAAPVLWVGDRSGQLGTVDVATGTVDVIGRMSQTMTDIAFDSSGNLWGISFGSLFRIDKTTATSTFVGDFGGQTLLNSLVFNSNGTLYAAGGSGLYSINTLTGAANPIGFGRFDSSGDLAFVGNELFLSSRSNSGYDSLVKLDTSNAAATTIGSIRAYDVFGLASPDGVNLYGLAGTSIYSVNTNTGLGSFISNYGGKGLFEANGSAFMSEAVSAVPVPAALFMFAPALLGLLGFRRRTKNLAI